MQQVKKKDVGILWINPKSRIEIKKHGINNSRF